ncbi:hypothetical protein ONR57_13300 [Hoyosella sp. YIM 151337]|uniref:DoxX family protein n=1 Tax=Hoyosella sp. YIM 151337 TaxID=2992742 RepID=UPI0022357223|nr:hypothetical protein [Hoyosella sp. YIM 151337]MCW4354277.1 hypothetical protein [Hoyosella sp. YIM 151337]
MTHPHRSRAAALRLAGLLIVAGSLHFVVPRFFDAIVPRYLPGDVRTYTYASGAAELAIGVSLVNPATRRLGATLAMLLFIAVFPANVQMAVDWLRNDQIPAAGKAGVVARLPLQIPLILEARKARG